MPASPAMKRFKQLETEATAERQKAIDEGNWDAIELWHRRIQMTRDLAAQQRQSRQAKGTRKAARAKAPAAE